MTFTPHASGAGSGNDKGERAPPWNLQTGMERSTLLKGTGPMRIVKNCLALAALAVGLAGAARAQTGFNFTDAQVANQAALRAYRWTSRMEVTQQGKVALSTLTLVSFDAHGQVKQDQIGGSDFTRPGQTFQNRRSQAQIRLNRLTDRTLEVTGELRKYQSPTAKQLDAFRSGAQKAPGTGDLAGTEQWSMTGWLKPDDAVSVWVDHKTGLQRQMQVQGTGGKQRFKAVYSFAPLPNGPWCLARSVVDIPALQVQIVTRNYGFTR
jgi:hypothetical protein